MRKTETTNKHAFDAQKHVSTMLMYITTQYTYSVHKNARAAAIELAIAACIFKFAINNWKGILCENIGLHRFIDVSFDAATFA